MSNNHETTAIRNQSPRISGKTDNSSKTKASYSNNGNLLNVRSVLLEKVLDDPEMQEVVVMEV